jgi:hypothetical protein
MPDILPMETRFKIAAVKLEINKMPLEVLREYCINLTRQFFEQKLIFKQAAHKAAAGGEFPVVRLGEWGYVELPPELQFNYQMQVGLLNRASLEQLQKHTSLVYECLVTNQAYLEATMSGWSNGNPDVFRPIDDGGLQ